MQGALEEALSLAFRTQIETTCAGRTDRGVHALGQVVSFNTEQDVLADKTQYSCIRSLNALTPDEISVTEFMRCRDGFSARFDAKSREYRYFICDKLSPPIFLNNFSWHLPRKDKLDISAMKDAAGFLIGEHDFKSFCMAASSIDKRTYRYVSSIEIERANVLGEEVVVIQVIGNAFLHSMVRAIVGTLVAVGKGLREPEWVKEVLHAKDRKCAGENAPAKGLILWNVNYD